MSGLADSIAAELDGQLMTAGAGKQDEWLVALRQQGLDRFRAHGLPTRRVERWKYTPLDALERRAPDLAEAEDGSVFEAGTAPLLENVPVLGLQDGRLAATPDRMPEGVRVQSLEQALVDADPDLRRLLLELEFADAAAALAALNTAALRNGAVIFVPRGVEAGTLLLQWTSTAAAAGALRNARVCVLLEPGASLELVEQFDSDASVASQLNVVMQVQLGEGARLTHARLQQSSAKGILITRTEVAQDAGSRYHYAGLDLGGELVRHDVRARLQSAGASCSLGGAALTRGAGHVDNHLDAEHLAIECSSKQWFRAVLADKSRVVFNGRVHVAPGADGTDAHQSSAGLLLSPQAEMDSKPELEIYADEVVASHGATVGQLDEEQLFYLQTRGLSREAARGMLTEAFCRSVVDQLPSAALRAALEDRLQAQLDAIGAHDG